MVFAQPYFQELVEFMASGPSHVLVISQTDASADAVPAWREFIGPADIEEARRDKPDRYSGATGYSSLGLIFRAVMRWKG